MKKVYSILTLLVLSVLSFNALAAKTVSIECTNVEALEIRDGGPEGTLLTAEVSPAKITFESESLYLAVGDDYLFTNIMYTKPDGDTEYLSNPSNPTTIAASSLGDDATIKVIVQQAKKVTLNVPDPSVVTVKLNGYDSNTLTMVEGANTLRLGEYGGFYVGVNDPEAWKMMRFYRVSDNREFSVDEFASVDVSGWEIAAGDEFSYELIPASEFVAPTFTVTVDNPAMADVTVDYKPITGLVANEPMEVTLPSGYASFTVAGKGGEDVYKVTKNGELLEAPYGYYNFTVHENDDVVVTAEFPEVYADVNISVEPAENTGVVKGVSCAGKLMENWTEKFQGQVGRKVAFEFDIDLFKLNSVTVNGVVNENLYTTFKTTIPEEGLNIVISADKYETYHATLNVDDPSLITASSGSNTLDLKSGDNDVEFTERAGQLSIEPASGCLLDKVVTVVGGEESEVDLGWGRAYINLQDGMLIKVEAHKIALDCKAVVYADHKSVNYDDQDETWSNIALVNGYDRTNYPFVEGYNFIEFSASFNPFAVTGYLSNYDMKELYVYLNGERMESDYGAMYEVELADRDVLKLFFVAEPESHTATFNIAEGCKVDVDKDYYTTVDPSAPVTDFAGTLFRVSSKEGAINVLDGDAAVTPDADGYYCVTLDADKTINVTAGGSTAVDNVAVDAAAQTDVYTATGVLVLKNATAAQIEALPAGVYVSAGKKFIVR